MIIDSLAHAGIYYGVHKDFKEVFDFLAQITSETESGKYVLREGEVWVNVSRVEDASAEDKSTFEAHRNFLDIHFIFDGEELFGYSNIDRLQVTKPYSAEGDYELLEGDIQKFTLKSGDFCVVYPEDAHIPNLRKTCEGVEVRVIAKIKL